MEKKLQKPYRVDYNSLTAQDLLRSSISNFDDNHADGIHKLNVNMDMIKKCRTCGIKYEF